MKPSAHFQHNLRTVHILAQDEALSSSLALAFGMLSFSALPTDSLETVTHEKQLGVQDVIFVDCSLVTSAEASLLRGLRRNQWQGTLVVMAESEFGCPILSDGEYRAKLLIKPFNFDDVLAVLPGSLEN